MPFVPMNLGYEQDLVSFYFEKINTFKSMRHELNTIMRQMIPSLEEIRIHQFESGNDVLSVTLEDQDEIYPLTRFGEGTVKFCRIALEVIMSKDRKLMIDEIDNGIHFPRLANYWKTIIQLCEKYKVQLFATTHSLECQQAFIEALEAPDMVKYQKDARNISLIENKKGEVLAVTYDFEQFEYAVNVGFNTRGGKQ